MERIESARKYRPLARAGPYVGRNCRLQLAVLVPNRFDITRKQVLPGRRRFDPLMLERFVAEVAEIQSIRQAGGVCHCLQHEPTRYRLLLDTIPPPLRQLN